MRILITGGSGSLGKCLIKQLQEDLELEIKDKHKLIIYSRDEGKQAEIQGKNIIKIIGDVRDKHRLLEIFEIYRPTHVIHAAALKRIDDMELYPTECVRTNIEGSANVACAAAQVGVEKCLLVSTDKACKPINVYGASKFIAERIFINHDFLYPSTSFSCVRYGNVIASRGSFIPLWMEKIKKEEEIKITDPSATRFLFTLNDACKFVLNSLLFSSGGEVFIPVLNSYKIGDVLGVIEGIIDKKTKVKTTGIRPGEKIHEQMLNEDEIPHAVLDVAKPGIVIILPQYGTRSYSYSQPYNGGEIRSDINTSSDLQPIRKIIQDLLHVN